MPDLAPLPPLDTAPLFPDLHAELLTLLRVLEPSDWQRPTVAGDWRVRDVAAHLLDGELRTLAAHRDGHPLSADGPVTTYEDVVELIRRLNAAGVAFGARLSPRLLTDLLEVTGRWMSAFVASLDPDAPALFAVAWAGEAESDNRFDTAREYTERWHHQMQIRAAVGERGRPAVLLAPKYLVPLVETSVRVLPHAYREVSAPDGTSVALRLAGNPSRAWTLRREGGSWRLYGGEAARSTARVAAEPDVLWRLFFNALPASEASRALAVDGPRELVAPLLRARSVMV
jgi:uncharacterized protein (TIGR03083 family)